MSEAEAAAEDAEAAETVMPEAAAETAEEVTGEITEESRAEDLTVKPELSMSMKKEELRAAARERGVNVSARATKAAIIEAIEKAEETDNL